VARTYSSADTTLRKGNVLEEIRENTIDILFLTPEMLTSQSFASYVPQLHNNFVPNKRYKWNSLAMLVIDEVHCISDWGHDFRPSFYFGLAALATRPWFKRTQVLGTSATVNERVMQDIKKIIPQPKPLRGDLSRPNIAIRVIQAPNLPSKEQWLLESFSTQWKTQNVLIFVELKTDTEKYATLLRDLKIDVAAYSSDLEPEKRTEVENDFRDGKLRVVVSTMALGMGFDKSDIHIVVHMYSPSSPIQYYQEIGRAGRDDKIQAKAYVLPSKPWRSDSWLRSWRYMFWLLQNNDKHKESRDQLTEMLQNRNHKNDDIDKTFDIAQKRGYIEISPDGIVTLLPASVEAQAKDDDEYTAMRQKEVAAMSNLYKLDKCIWQQLLGCLGQPNSPLCTTCSVCKPFDETECMVNPFAIQECCYRSTTKGGMDVFSLGVNDENVIFSTSRAKNIIQSFQKKIDGDPPMWHLVYIPNADKDNNEAPCKELSEALRMPYFTFVKPVPKTRGMTDAHSDKVRQERIQKKFPPRSFDLTAIPPGGFIIYDDCMKSGTTLDHISQRLRDMKREVVGFVQKLYTGKDFPVVKRVSLRDGSETDV